ncbi:MAG: hypothetical protein Q9179_004551 [Wetmoreana sp. 5 TL-2023]
MFRYGKLNGSEIRLVRILRGTDDKSIHLELKHFKLDKAPPFYALSYCWGDITSVEKCSCEYSDTEGLLALTSSLCKMLSMIEAKGCTNGLPLWVDQICINQTDWEEKADQITLMGQIYAAAQKTLIDLGEENPSDQKAFALLSCLIQEHSTWKLQDPEKNEDIFEMAPEDFQHFQADLGFKLQSFDHMAWEALIDVRYKPWFTRLWVVQEHVLSRDPVVIFCSEPIFALLGIADNIEDLLKEINYMEPCYLTYTRAALFVIKQDTLFNDGIQTLQILSQVDPAISSVPKYGPSWVPYLRYLVDESIDVDNQLAYQHEFSNRVLAIATGIAGIDIEKLIRLSVRGICIGSLSHLHSRNPVHPMMGSSSDLDRKPSIGASNIGHRAAWRTSDGLTVIVHSVCDAGDMIYVLAGSSSPCVLRKVNGYENVFNGLAWTELSVRTETPFVTRLPEGNRDWHLAAELLRVRCNPSTLSVEEWCDAIWDPWLRRENKNYPFVTEQLVLV